MRLSIETDGRIHPADGGVNDHHPRPVSVSINNTTQSLPPGTSYNLDISLPHGGFKIARIQIMGAKAVGAAGSFREGAEIVASTDADQAMAISTREAAVKKSYVATYSKQNGDAYLSHKIFDSNTGSTALYIAVTAAVIIGSTLRITFRNYFGGSATLWVKGQALLW
jgi:hypothetical protein